MTSKWRQKSSSLQIIEPLTEKTWGQGYVILESGKTKSEMPKLLQERGNITRQVWGSEGVIHLGLRPLWITPSLICRILHILWKPNSIIALLFIQNISSFLKEFHHYALCFPLTKYNITLSPGFLGQRFNNLWRAALLTSFWLHWFNNFRWAPLLTSFIQCGEDCFQIWWTAAGYGELCVWF